MSPVVFHEVTCSADGQIIRGAIDCLIRQRTIDPNPEFKTGRRRDEHRQAGFTRAAAAVFPDSMIVIDVLYA